MFEIIEFEGETFYICGDIVFNQKEYDEIINFFFK